MVYCLFRFFHVEVRLLRDSYTAQKYLQFKRFDLAELTKSSHREIKKKFSQEKNQCRIRMYRFQILHEFLVEAGNEKSKLFCCFATLPPHQSSACYVYYRVYITLTAP